MMAEISEKDYIFFIPVGEWFNKDSKCVYLIYAPLKGMFVLGTKPMTEELKLAFDGKSENEDAIKTANSFICSADIQFDKMRHDTKQLYEIEILANNICNFSCVYCYSAKGRSTQRLSLESIKTLVDFLFSDKHYSKRPYAIHFSGGGEPLLSFDIIQQVIPYIKQAYTTGNHHPFTLGLVTNGSLLTLPIAQYLHDNGVEIIISFEILKDLQNKERGSYDKVAGNIRVMQENNIPFGVRTTFTPDSVHRMGEMIEEVHQTIPRIKNLTFDVVLAPDLFHNPRELEEYYDAFLEEYYKTKQQAQKYGISIYCVAAEPLYNLRDRACFGKLVLTPWNSITACARVSSPQERVYDKYVFGKIEDSNLVIDNDKFSEIVSDKNVYTNPVCWNCFAKWNCGGGCRLMHDSFESDFVESYCKFQRKALVRQIIENINRRFITSKGKSIYEYIDSLPKL